MISPFLICFSHDIEQLAAVAMCFSFTVAGRSAIKVRTCSSVGSSVTSVDMRYTLRSLTKIGSRQASRSKVQGRQPPVKASILLTSGRQRGHSVSPQTARNDAMSRKIHVVERTTPQGTLIGLTIRDAVNDLRIWADDVNEIESVLCDALNSLKEYKEKHSIQVQSNAANRRLTEET